MLLTDESVYVSVEDHPNSPTQISFLSLRASASSQTSIGKNKTNFRTSVALQICNLWCIHLKIGVTTRPPTLVTEHSSFRYSNRFFQIHDPCTMRSLLVFKSNNILHLKICEILKLEILCLILCSREMCMACRNSACERERDLDECALQNE